MTTLKFYLASGFEFKAAVQSLAEALESRGHKITCRWWLCDFKVSLGVVDDDDWYAKPIIRTIYRRSHKAIEDADILIIVAPEVKKFNGANVEVGIALGLHKPVICLGELERSAMYEPLIRCKTFDDLKEVLREFEER
jgi:nucleoside 2-deoxyribosyltransferase